MTQNIVDIARQIIAAHDYSTAGVADLSARERDVIELVTNGYSNAEISRLLNVTHNTVKTYVRSTYRKIGAETRAQAIVWGVRNGLLAGTDAATEQPIE